MLDIWEKHLIRLSKGSHNTKEISRSLAIDELAEIANKLLNIVIRAIDYCPSVDIYFGDFVHAS